MIDSMDSIANRLAELDLNSAIYLQILLYYSMSTNTLGLIFVFATTLIFCLEELTYY